METRRLVKGGHTRKTAAFVRACAAYCFITIPSVDNILLRLNLYLLSGRVAVANGALSQGGCFAAVDPHYLILHITLCSESGCTHLCLVIYSQRTQCSMEGGVCVIMCLYSLLRRCFFQSSDQFSEGCPTIHGYVGV